MSKHAELQALKQEIFSSLHCALPGVVKTYDSTNQCADIQIAVKSRSGVEYPLLSAVPVFMPVSFTVNAGDWCLVIFSDVDLDRWLSSGEQEVPPSKRMHSLSDGFAFVGFKAVGG